MTATIGAFFTEEKTNLDNECLDTIDIKHTDDGALVSHVRICLLRTGRSNTIRRPI
jgi:hypothetical protein